MPEPNTLTEQRVIHSAPDILGGAPVFVGTRVPVQALIDYVEANHPLNEFLDVFSNREPRASDGSLGRS